MIAAIDKPRATPATKPTTTPEHISASRLGCWCSCRLKYFFRYVAKIVKPTPPALHVGKTVHSVLQAWNKGRWHGEPFSDEGLYAEYVSLWRNHQVDDKVEWEPGTEDAAISATWNLLSTYLERTPIPPNEKPVGVEVRAEADLQGLGKLVGIIDLVRPGGSIVDFKTTKQTPVPEKVEHMTELQLTAYGVLFREATGDQEHGFEIHSLIKQKTPKVHVLELPATSDRQIERLTRTAESFLHGVANRDWVPSPGIGCAMCEYFNECRAWPDTTEGGAA